ncbi:hypothetical protein LX97_02666 [Nonlabens dokdonensis]|jgi:hypothetical protein|uniref:Uncharacterized protein n=2 Tax=Nonlabens dokdonensis TaxID=328515 RepID=L7WEK5_NONDD|nr:DUF6090 family protein [Nonlabens dokdonensis]AGC78569.1 hypothetical protein DDD_3442 [Nonlabens dokdonensis DSW-6]PZX39300.1 hypothetical protein LX97_02666 [Nonlabens dokdonensis]
MIKFLRKYRLKTLLENKLGRYVFYAIGEIILVVIGILIALHINNLNENKKSDNQLSNIYNEVRLNLKSDLADIDEIIIEYQELQNRLEKMVTVEYSNILLDSITADNYLDCIPCQGDINSYIPFEIKDKGFELLKTFNDFNAKNNKELTNEILEFYTIKESANIVLDKLKEESFNNIKFFEEFPWYNDFMNGTYNPEAINFFAKNQRFKNKVITYKLIAIKNYLPLLKQYKVDATVLLNKLEKA